MSFRPYGSESGLIAMGYEGYVPLTIGRGIRCAASLNPERIALDDTEGNQRSYRALIERMDAIGGLAHQRGIGKGDVVALVAPNRLEYPEVTAGLSENGIIVATLNPMLSKDELANIFADCKPRMVIAAESVRLPEDRPDTVLLGESFEGALEACHGHRVLPELDERDTFAIAYTSGTTGAPKGVLLSHRSRCLMFYAMAGEYGCFGRDDHFLALAPMCHGAGLAFALAPLFQGGRCTLQYSQEPESILASLADHRPNGIFVVPTHLHRLYNTSEAVLDRYKGQHNLRTIISNAAALAPPLKEFAVQYFGPGLLNESYGSTEGGIVTNMRPSGILRKPKSVGTAFSNIQVEIRREDGTPTSAGEPGELFCRSPFSFNGYLNQPDATQAALIDGWVTVGDIAVWDEDGAITITDRKKDVIITGGINVYPREVESIVESMPEVLECAVVGRPDDEWGESLHAYAVLKSGCTLAPSDVADLCRARLAAYKVPQRVSFVAALPRNAAGKLLKKELRALNVPSD